MSTDDHKYQNNLGEEFRYFLSGYTSVESRIETLRKQEGESAYWAATLLTRGLNDHVAKLDHQANYRDASANQNPNRPSALRAQGQAFAYALAILDSFAAGRAVRYPVLEKAVSVLQQLGAHRGDLVIERLVRGSAHQPDAIIQLLERFYGESGNASSAEKTGAANLPS